MGGPAKRANDRLTLPLVRRQAVSTAGAPPAPPRRHPPLIRPLMAARHRLRRTRERAAAAVGDGAFNRRVLARALGRHHVLCLGDSHVEVMDRVRVPHVWFRAKPVTGATASGLQNPQSASQATAIFEARLERAKPWQEVLLQLGEVDCGFLIWHRAGRLNLDVGDQLASTLDTYAHFIARVRARGFKRVIVLSVPLPTIGDDPDTWGEVASLRRAVTASQAERTELTMRFNRGLRRRCETLGVPFVDATSAHLDERTGLVDRGYVRETHHDHHLAEGPYSRLIAREIRALWQS